MNGKEQIVGKKGTENETWRARRNATCAVPEGRAPLRDKREIEHLCSAQIPAATMHTRRRGNTTSSGIQVLFEYVLLPQGLFWGMACREVT